MYGTPVGDFRKPRASSSDISVASRRAVLSLGAAGGAAVLWLGVGVVNGLVTEIGWSWVGASTIAAGVSAVLACVLAWVILGAAANRAP